MKKRLILIRHGQTQFNVEGRVQGWADSPLTSQGISQMKLVRHILCEEKIVFENIYSSDLKRAMDSAKIIAPDANLFVTEALREYSFGPFDGKTEIPDWDKLPDYGAETLEHCQNRLASALVTILERETTAIVVSHGICASLILAMSEHENAPDHFSNGAILCFDYEDGNLKFNAVLNNT